MRYMLILNHRKRINGKDFLKGGLKEQEGEHYMSGRKSSMKGGDFERLIMV